MWHIYINNNKIILGKALKDKIDQMDYMDYMDC